ncbi:MAG: hypothetical protein ACLQC7_05930 [Thermoplasmata archaeon]
MPRGVRARLLRPAFALLVALLLVAVGPSSSARAAVRVGPLALPGLADPASFGNLSISLDRQFLGNLSAPSIAPAGSTRIQFGLAEPAALASSGTLLRVVLTFQVYAFNGYPGDGSAQLPVSNAPVLSNATASGALVNVSTPSLASGAPLAGSVGISTASGTPSGTYAVRTALSFVLKGTDYRLESRGWFSAATWTRATEEPNGTPTLNLSVLGVSGVLPETALLVSSSDWAWALGALLAGAFVLLAAGAWVYSRRGPGSTAGAG